MRFGPREIMFMLVLLATPVAAYFLIFQPRNVQIAEAQAEIKEKNETLEMLESAAGTQGELSDEIEKLEQAIEEFSERLPDAEETDDILRQITNIASDHQLQVASVRMENTVRNPHWSEQQLSLEITGDFDGFYSFLLDLEQLPRITRITQLKISNETRRDRLEAEETADVHLSIFFEGTEG